MTSEAFTNDFIDALRDKRMDTFKHRYRASYDVLLVDDVQFLAGRERIQEEFFHTFNALHEAGRQVVLTCDRPVREIAGLEDRLRSRFEWGLITDVQPPDLETRIAILRKRVAADRVAIADPSVLTTIAQRVTTNIRELEGALTRVLAFASLTGRPVSPELVREVLHDLEGSLGAPSIDAIQALVAETFGISVAELCSARRSQAVVHPRQIAMYLTPRADEPSLPAIGRAFGGRDHTTVLYAVNRIGRAHAAGPARVQPRARPARPRPSAASEPGHVRRRPAGALCMDLRVPWGWPWGTPHQDPQLQCHAGRTVGTTRSRPQLVTSSFTAARQGFFTFSPVRTGPTADNWSFLTKNITTGGAERPYGATGGIGRLIAPGAFPG